MSEQFVFGYGSLVNCATHTYTQPHKARLRGWRRQWVSSVSHHVTFLSVRSCDQDAIDGLIANVPDNDWAALDRRESGYARQILDTAIISHTHPDRPPIQMYKAREPLNVPAPDAPPILLSYLDTVIAGFLEIYGEPGVARFFASTDGWDAPILHDRADPIYPRAVPLTKEVETLVNEFLGSLLA